jgi:ATP-dependent helicase/nuclease subunit B
LTRIARQASEALFWIAPTAPEASEEAFLAAYAKKQPVVTVLLDWRDASLPQPYAGAWPQMMEAQPGQPQQFSIEHADTGHLRLCETSSLEDEAVQGAQTIVDWLQQGKQNLAVVAQDRVTARRIRALLERAQVHVADETGWKLSTTRAAAALAAWMEVVATQADTIALLDFLKSPYFDSDANASEAFNSDQVMHLELILRKANVGGGWDAIAAALRNAPGLLEMIAGLQRRAAGFASRRSLAHWGRDSLQALQELGMQLGLAADPAGAQVLQLLRDVQGDCAGMDSQFSFAEWRAFLNMQLEAAPFVTPHPDKRVVMLPLNGTRLRSFDAVLLVGADAAHLPSQPQEVLFFTNAVRRECGLATREALQRQQLRDFAELLLANEEVVLSWQGQLNGEHNPVSPWLAQLGLSQERNGQPALRRGRLELPAQRLNATVPVQPRPRAPMLTPATLSASGYASLVACPYQFFAGRMLGLDAMEALSDMPEKRDYGDWLHAILRQYHESLRDNPVPTDEREAMLRDISRRHFDPILQQSPAALGYITRWDKTIPAYVEWANAREEAGWHFVMGEGWNERTLAWPGGEITLRGRIDRLDRDKDGKLAVLDYKTRTVTALAKRLKQGEDQQLPFYGLLAGTEAANASYVALEQERGKTGSADAQDYQEWTEALEHAIKDNMGAIQKGAPLPAQGVQSVCQYCEMRGLCRKGAW